MNGFICKHRLINIGDPIYEWCRQCGILIYRYEEYMTMPAEDIQFIDGHLIYNKSNCRIERSRIIEPLNYKDLTHEHDFFILSSSDSWCKICGTLDVKRTIPSHGGFKYHTRSGLLIPQRRKSAIDVRENSGMIGEK